MAKNFRREGQRANAKHGSLSSKGNIKDNVRHSHPMGLNDQQGGKNYKTTGQALKGDYGNRGKKTVLESSFQHSFKETDVPVESSQYYAWYQDVNNNKDRFKLQVDSHADLANLISLAQLAQINALPPIPDNIVDPPVLINEGEIGGAATSWDSGRCGMDFVNRVLMRGQFLTLVPIELKPLISYMLNSTALGQKAGFGAAFSGRADTWMNKIENRMNISSYGYQAKINYVRYWSSVVSHMKIALHALGIDSLTGSRMSKERINLLQSYLPHFIVENIIAGDIWATVRPGLSSNTEDLSKVQIDAAASDDSGKNAINKGFDALMSKAGKAGKLIGDLMSGGGYSNSTNTMDSTDDASNWNVGAVNSNSALASANGVMEASYGNLLAAVMNIDLGSGVKQIDLPYVVFYCDGSIERNMTFNIESEQSALAATFTDIGAKGLNALATGAGWIAGGEAKESVQQVSDVIQGGEDIMKEIVYHNRADAVASIITNTYVPNVMKGGSADFSYNVQIRETCQSHKYSLIRPFFTISSLLPFVVQTTKPRHPLIIPTSAMYCMAFSKGVMNCPRAYISSLTIKTDPAFQTTNGIPTDFTINLTIQPLYRQTVMPDFSKAWGGANDLNLLSAMWNPMSSMNIVATLAGANTVLTKLPVNLFQFFVSGPLDQVWKNLKHMKGYFGASLKDFYSSAQVSATNALLK